MQQNVDWCDIARNYMPDTRSCRVFRLLTDTTDYYDVEYGDVALLGDVGYLIRGAESEKKFGLEGEPKPWVKSCIDLTDGERKILKLAFLEEFACRVEGNKFTCMRNPEKEARILDKVRNHSGFMQGIHTRDAAGNNVRVLDRVKGVSLDNHIRGIPGTHESYYFERLPEILVRLAEAFRHMHALHEMGEIHGDITPDHVFRRTDDGLYVWIDFDYDYKDFTDLVYRDLLEMGALLSFVVGKEWALVGDLHHLNPAARELVTPSDLQMTLGGLIANLRLVFPYIHEQVNRVLMQFAVGSTKKPRSASELADQMEDAAHAIR